MKLRDRIHYWRYKRKTANIRSAVARDADLSRSFNAVVAEARTLFQARKADKPQQDSGLPLYIAFMAVEDPERAAMALRSRIAGAILREPGLSIEKALERVRQDIDAEARKDLQAQGPQPG